MEKKIHYCWFGRGNKPKIFYKCLKSWKKNYPDYEIIEWNEDNFDINCNEYVKDAYRCKKYAFVSDYARLKIIYDCGGLYFDTDVESLKRIDDNILKSGFFAKETQNTINTGLGFGASKNNKIIKMLMDDYNNEHFLVNGEMNLKTCVQRVSELLVNKGYNISNDNCIIDGIPVYNPEFFCGFDVKNDNYLITSNTYNVHHYSGTWLSKKDKTIMFLKRTLSKIVGIKNYEKLRKLKNRKKDEK